jgi:hypothetical protein
MNHLLVIQKSRISSILKKLNLANMKTRIVITVYFLSLSLLSGAQWEVGAGTGISLPVTGYSKVVKPGHTIFNLEGKYRFKAGNFALGFKTQMARFSKDKNPADAFHGAKLTVAPLLFTAEYGMNKSGNFQPYIAGGLGLSFFALSYNSSSTAIDDKSVFNVSFTMLPLIGFRYKASKRLYPFIESGLVLLADGPPAGFPKGEKMTGYNFISTGVIYHFTK